jgi:von Willebrand factor type A domain
VRRALVLVALAAAEDEPKPLRIEARLDGDMARFSVHYLVRAEMESPTGMPLYSLPYHGLITSAVVVESGQRHVLALVPKAEAAESFGALFEKPPARARTWAALVEVDQYYRSAFTLSTAVPRRTSFAADVEITAPTCFDRDARYVLVPDEWVPRLPATTRTRNPAHVGEVCGDELHSDAVAGWAWVKFPATGLASRAGGADRIGTYANRTALGKTSFVKVELNLAAKLSEVPADLATVILVDASRSTSKEQLEAQRETVAAYLRAAPHGRVQVIEYARHARALLPGWTTAVQAVPRVARELQAMQRKNGSNISVGLREAGKWLAQTTGTRRILLFTDEQLTTQQEHTHAIDDALPPSTLVHVVALGGSGLARDDDAKLARLAKRTRGLSVRGGEPELDKPAKLDATLLARPISLDHVRVRTPGWVSLSIERACPETADELGETSFAEGEACTWWGHGDAVASPFVVEGFLWGERVERVVRADLSRSLDVVRELSAMHILDEELQTLADRAARAVNAVWSLYTAWGGNGGYNDIPGGGGTGFGITCGGCRTGDIGSGTRIGTISLRVDLSVPLEQIARTCKPSEKIAIEVETTLEEIVDVAVEGGTPALRTCVEEALWTAWLVAPGAPVRTITRFVVEP